MDRQRDLELILRSRMPIVVIETRDESRMLDLLKSITISRASDSYVPLFRWTVTDGLQRLDISLEPQMHNAQPTEVLRHIRAVAKPGMYVLLDFHPYLEDPVNVRLLKDICIQFDSVSRHLILISHSVALPKELESFSARFDMALPSEQEREEIVKRVAIEWSVENAGSRVKFDPKAHRMLIQNLAGLTDRDTAQLARNAIYEDGAISKSDLPQVMQAKYELLNRGGILRYEYDTKKFSDVGGLDKLKTWISQRKPAFLDRSASSILDSPKGILLIGVQGCGKSLAAKATAGIFGVPLLRLDFGSLYDKYHGETERKLRESLKTADVMAPCVLWIDEIEKGIAGKDSETGTSQRVLGTFLTWLAEKKSPVFTVATANDIASLPPELVRKGRFDEIFFVDLPRSAIRKDIFDIHLELRGQDPSRFESDQLVRASRGFSGAEIEQAVVSALYSAHAQQSNLETHHLLEELKRTKPLSVVMAERIDAIRRWAVGRTVACD
ncbi:MAG: AAA family ATPase [Gammaproteobacteria bacterium]|nr:AAA family ATPase [Gammaproteobacteria bacterium]MDH4314543.1 AAA family ATPase [Gammaproteobacteria bacterium]MDH5213976.1 AAA family ATPase [Gammaproteobacteria bacterium]MDH5500439.1 AAA family ATPase [Gammaproteobacteria bacterium]